MKYIISGKNIEVTDGLRSAVEDKLDKLNKYFSDETNLDKLSNIITTGYISDSEMKSLMKHAKAYKIIVSENQKLAVLLRPQTDAPDVKAAYLLYDGSDRAYLYRSKRDVILLDHLNPQILSILAQVKDILVIEADWNTNETLYDYTVEIRHEKYI